ncbi:crotonase/enoyl-CoA hydratase family protein [Halieaceae bacterium IMCC14734]|uniref:Crotonase/enoyl-CoA hydratase family protein n=1 Tax=Candidatus Litorirhabdus singularis TaxID=2518993 RepID=A0ABT3TD43_9GAMM|nr:enoyl-CoA hydratase-related protein [Candidatus Litorirhabdus singularis]MCX2980199.1 crotonase/enoyl-CoA hydratase family protein [Candidatus Litorirhabdus singularis]
MSAILFEKRGQQAWITLNRPQHKNIMNGEMFVQLADAWQEVRDDSAIRVAVVTAAGDRDFCCGGDLGELIPLWTGARQPQNELEQRLLDDPMIPDKIMLKGEPLYKPIIAAINGRALGGGTELLQATDIRIAADHAQFGLPEPRAGVVPGAGSMVRLARQLPYAHAMKILLGGEPVSAAEALAMGLVSEVVPLEQLQARAEHYAENVCRQAPLALQAIKRTAIETHTQSWADAYSFEMEQAGAVMMSKDAREGPRAFKEKRAPEFRGE